MWSEKQNKAGRQKLRACIKWGGDGQRTKRAGIMEEETDVSFTVSLFVKELKLIT